HFYNKMVGAFIHNKQNMFMFKAYVYHSSGQAHPFALPAGRCACWLLKMMNIQFTQYLLHLCSKIPRIQLIYLNYCQAHLFGIARVCSGFKSTYGVDHGMIMIENIIEYRLVFFKYRFLLKKCHSHIFMYPNLPLVCGFSAG